MKAATAQLDVRSKPTLVAEAREHVRLSWIDALIRAPSSLWSAPLIAGLVAAVLARSSGTLAAGTFGLLTAMVWRWAVLTWRRLWVLEHEPQDAVTYRFGVRAFGILLWAGLTASMIARTFFGTVSLELPSQAPSTVPLLVALNLIVCLWSGYWWGRVMRGLDSDSGSRST